MSDPLWEDAPEYLANGDAILVRDIRKAIEGEDFQYYPGGEGMPVDMKGIEPAAWAYYFEFFAYSEEFGLPHGSGWLDELPWVTDFLLFMKRKKQEVEVWRIRRGFSPSEK